ncbi:MAG: NAD(P)H-hydrate epimerase [Pseudomonadota bacterium]
MPDLLTAAQMRAIERAAIDSGQVTGLELMERAGRGSVAAILRRWPEFAKAPHRAAVLCGPGNNGGDGFVVARLLKERGWDVEVFLYGQAHKLPPDAAENHRRWTQIGATSRFEDLVAPAASAAADLVVDAVFGTGLARPVADAIGDALNRAGAGAGTGARSPAAVKVAIDVPSGLCADSGRALGAVMASDLTVSFHSEKVGHRLSIGPGKCGAVCTVDIGLGHAKAASTDLCRLAVAGRDPTTGRHAVTGGKPVGDLHKYDHGHALILSGGPGRGGAARLAARGALRIGSGLVTVGCPPAALQENAARLDAVMLRPLADARALTGALADPRINALCLGPGLGVSDRTRALVLAALAPRVPGLTQDPDPSDTTPGGPGAGAGARSATVLDADALTAFAEDPQTLFDALHPDCVLTPHAGEFRRLFPDLHDRLTAPPSTGPAYSKLDATRDAAARAGCTVLFKGADTVIADPAGRAVINSAHYDRAAPWLATAGSGDVLAGFVTGLLARGFTPVAAAETAAWLHVECARHFGPGLIAEDLPEQLPAVFRALDP